jgi:hypothetical protein
MTKHLEWETLNDYVDDAAALDAAVRRDAADHLADCSECREKAGRLRAIVAAAADISQVAPPAAAWEAIDATIDRRKSVHLSDRKPGTTGASRALNFWIAAAVSLMVASSLLLYSFSRGKAGAGRPAVVASAAASVPVEVQRIDAEYGATAEALAAEMKEPRVQVNAPGVVEAVARSIAVIDTAIAEARDALIKDPSSESVRVALVRNYQQKIDLLRRVTARASSN